MTPRNSMSRLTRTALIATMVAAALAGSGCRGKKDEQPAATSTAAAAATGGAGAAAGTAKTVRVTLTTEVKPLTVNVPVAPPKLDGVDVKMGAIDTRIASPAIPNLSIALPAVSIGTIAVPAVDTSVAISGPSISSLIPSGVPTGIPTGIPTAPAGIPGGVLPPGITIPPGFGPPAGVPFP